LNGSQANISFTIVSWPHSESNWWGRIGGEEWPDLRVRKSRVRPLWSCEWNSIRRSRVRRTSVPEWFKAASPIHGRPGELRDGIARSCRATAFEWKIRWL